MSTPRTEPHRRRWALVALPVLLFAALAGAFAYALRTGDPSRLPSALIGKQAPDVALVGMDGLRRDGKAVPGFAAKDLATGEPTLVNFFASWCVPCAQEHPFLVALAEREKLRIVGVNYKDPVPGGLRFLERHGNPYAAVGVDAGGRAAIEWGVYGMPETFLVDGKGRIVYKHVGALTAEIIAGRLLPALAKARGG
ncbi:MAG: DsbE family thiol:disulfide interchange protein [Hyphomicrobiaceae bacterium]